MRAWQVFELGEPDRVMRLGERASLDPGPGEVIVDVAACGCNFSDVLLCRGEYQEQPVLPFTPGTEVVGRVLAAGDGALHPPGSRVLGRALLPDGALAEQARLPAGGVLALDEAVDDAVAAALYVTYQTAWFGLHHRAGLRAGETLLVHAGAGGTGSAAVQLGVAAGATVIATAGGAAKAEQCRALGADVVIDHRSDDVRAAVLDATSGRGVDVVFDPVGGDLLDVARRLVAFEGRIVVVGFASGRMLDLPANHIFVKNYAVLGLHWPRYEALRPDLVARAHAEILALHAAGHVQPLISAVCPLEDAADALADLGAGRTTGKLVVRP
jgi:NADPH2:quinone reductase